MSRRKRIQERVATMQQGDATGVKEGERREEAGKGKQQIVESKRRLFRVKLRTDQEVTSIRVAGDDREQQHRIQEEQTRQELRAKLLAEAEQSARQNAAVAMKWADLFSIEVPQDLYEQIEKQRQACERIIASKDKLILDIKNELKKKDDEFVKTLKRQAEDTDTLLQYMSRQFVEMQAAYNEELEEIESAFLQERADLLSSNQMEIQDLSDKRTRLEQEFMERYLSSVERYQLDLENLRIQVSNLITG
jgi:dynein regulatory complex protein 1